MAWSVASAVWPRLRAVSSTVAYVAWAAAPHSERKPPVTLRCTTDGRSACSDPLLVGGTPGSSRKTNRCSRCSRNRTHKRLASAPGTGVALVGAVDRQAEQRLAVLGPRRLLPVDGVL